MLVDVIGIPLRRQDGRVEYALVDPEDFAWLNEWRWCLHQDEARAYAMRNSRTDGRNSRIFMHRVIMGLERGDSLVVDHRNRNALDNRRENLRVVTVSQNFENQGSRGGISSHRGVTFDRRCNRWIAQATVRGKYHWLGYHDTEEAAAIAASQFRATHMPYAIEAAAA